MTRQSLAALALAAVFASGCARPLNDRPTIGGRLTTGTFAAPIATTPALDTHAGLDRSAWPGQVFLVPVDGSVHGPVWHADLRFANTTARQQGLMPTAETALELDGGTGNAQALEAVVAPFASLVDVALFPVRLFVDPPFANRQSPEWLYKRSQQGGWSSATVTTPLAATPSPAYLADDGYTVEDAR